MPWSGGPTAWAEPGQCTARGHPEKREALSYSSVPPPVSQLPQENGQRMGPPSPAQIIKYSIGINSVMNIYPK